MKNLKDILLKSKVHNRIAQQQLYAYTYSELCTAVAIYAKDKSERDWIFNLGMMRIFTSLDNYQLGTNFLGWARTILVRSAIDHLRSNKAHQQNIAPIDIEDQQVSSTDFDQLMNEINTENILLLLQRLPKKERMIFNMYEIEGYNHKENQSGIAVNNENNSDPILDTKENNFDYSRLNMLPIQPLILDDSLNQKNLAYLKQNASSIIRLPKVRRFYLAGKLGPASFNQTSGYHLSSGIFWDINKLIGLGSNLAYSTGSDKSRRIGDVFQKEQQIDLSILFHLNLHRSLKHKFSVELGGGYTYYWENRIIGPSQPISVRKSNGWNLQGGISYTYFMRRKHGIGFKVGLISYDDEVNYFAIRYLYKF